MAHRLHPACQSLFCPAAAASFSATAGPSLLPRHLGPSTLHPLLRCQIKQAGSRVGEVFMETGPGTLQAGHTQPGRCNEAAGGWDAASGSRIGGLIYLWPILSPASKIITMPGTVCHIFALRLFNQFHNSAKDVSCLLYL